MQQVAILYNFILVTLTLISFSDDRKTLPSCLPHKNLHLNVYNICWELHQPFSKAYEFFTSWGEFESWSTTSSGASDHSLDVHASYRFCILGQVFWPLSTAHGLHLYNEKNISMYFLILGLIKNNTYKTFGMFLAHNKY